MADYKKHAEPAGHAFPDARRPREARAAMLQRWQEHRLYERIRARREGAAALRAARRPAVRERRHPHRPRGQQDPEGHHRQEEDAVRVRRAVRARLGLPRHADRSADREAVRQEPAARGDAAPVPRLRGRADRAAEARLPAPRRARRLGPPVSHDGVSQRGRRDPRARARCSSRATSTAASSRSTGASTAARRSPKPKSSTRTARTRRSTSAFRSPSRRSSRGPSASAIPTRRATR